MKKIIIFALLVSSVGCSGYSVTGGPGKTAPPSLNAQVDNSNELLGINALYVAKVEDDRAEHEANAKVVDFDSLLAAALNRELALKLIYESEAKSAKQSVKDLIDRGRGLGADGVLVTRVHNFVERQGGRLGSDRPASVDFTMNVLRVSDGHSVWQSSFHFKDQALSENLFRINQSLSKGKGQGFKSADDLLSSGFKTAVNDFSSRRLNQFSTK